MRYQAIVHLLGVVLCFLLCTSCTFIRTKLGSEEEKVEESPPPIVDTEEEGSPLIDSGAQDEENAAGPSEAVAPSTEQVETGQPQAEQAAEVESPAIEAEELSPPASQPPASGPLTTAELRWQIPAEAVERYHIAYGTAPDTLSQKVSVNVDGLERLDDPIHGPLFRYLLHNIPAGEKVYFTIQAENSYGTSPESPVQEIE